MPDLSQASPAGSKTCTACGVEKDLEQFNWRNRSKGYRMPECKPCASTRQKKWRQRTGYDKKRYWEVDKDCPKRRAQRLRADMKARYGITIERYDELLEEQNNGCAICGKTPEENGKRLAVDHNHDTGEVRGLLCNPCNTGIGLLQDNPRLTANATTYLLERGSYADD